MEREEKSNIENLQIEAFDYVQYSLRRYHNHQLNGCLHMNGIVDEKKLQQAVISTFEDLPQLCATFEKGNWKKTEQADLFQIQVKEGAYRKEDISSYFAETVLLQQPFQVSIRLFRNDRKDTMAIVLNHMLCDGMDFKRYLYLLCQRYNEQEQTIEDAISYRGLPRDLSWVRKEKVRKRPYGQKPKRERIPMEPGKLSCFLHETMPATKFALIKTYTEKQGVDIDDYFLAAYYKTIAKVFHYPVKTICCTEDLRGYYKGLRGLSNQSGTIYCSVKEAEKLSFEELLHSIHDQRKEEKEQRYCLRQIKELNRVITHLPQKAANNLIDEIITNPKIVFTNLGTIEEEKLLFGDVRPDHCYITEPLKRTGNLQITASLFREEVTFGCNMMVSEKEKIRLTYFLQIFYVCLMEEVIP